MLCGDTCVCCTFIVFFFILDTISKCRDLLLTSGGTFQKLLFYKHTHLLSSVISTIL